MPVASTDTFYFYNTDGFTLHFAYPFYVDSSDSIEVTTVINGVLNLYFLTTDYTLSGPQDSYGAWPTGLVVNMNVAPDAGILLIARKTKRTQETLYVNNNAFTAESVNHALDKLTVMLQDYTAQFLGVAQGPPTDVINQYFIGQWYKNSIPQAGGPFGWICTQGGSPGTWKEFGTIST